jgi:Penicillin binding protein transpeptidase domain
MNRGAKTGVISVVVAGLVTLGGLGAYNLAHGLTAGDTSSDASAPTPTAGAAEATAPVLPGDSSALQVAQGFLKDWQAGPGQYAAAAGRTNSPSVAQADLTGYRSGLKLTSIAFSGVTAGGPSSVDPGASTVNFTVAARVDGGTWTYPDTLNIVDNNGQSSVDWASAMLYPKLLAGQSLQAGPVTSALPTATVTASDGTVLTKTAYPSLAGIIGTLSQSGGSGGSSPDGVQIVDASGSPVSTVTTFGSTGSKVVTTIDAKLQGVAEQAVNKSILQGLPTAVVALDPNTGHILASAYANSGGDGDIALESAGPPGSTMKIITSAALFDMAGLNPDSAAPCNLSQPAADQTFTNESDVPVKTDATIEWSFAESCNTAFVKDGFDKLVTPLGGGQYDASDLSKEAHDVFGLGQWNIGGGLQVTTPQVLAQPQGSDVAADLIGQGTVEMTPLDMASVSATVDAGVFHQPVILPGLSPAGASQSFGPDTDRYLKDMMEFDAHNSIGTAEPRLQNIPGSGGKTGTAQVGDGNVTNGWFTAFGNGIAVAAVVEGGQSGVDTAGYVVQQLLESGK